MSELRLPPDRFFFAELDDRDFWLHRLTPSRSQEAHLYQFETRIPLAADEVHASFVRINPTTVLVCAMSRIQLCEFADKNPEATRLIPESLPDWLSEDSRPIDPTALNLLIGEFTPTQIRRRNSRSITRTAAMISVAALVAAFGLHRRTSALNYSSVALQSQANVDIADSLAIETDHPRLHAMLTSELRRLRATRQGPATEKHRPDIAHQAAQLLAAWPTGLQTDRLTLGTRGGSVVARGPSSDKATQLIDSLEQLSRWSVSSPSVNETKGEYQIRLSLTTNEGNQW